MTVHESPRSRETNTLFAATMQHARIDAARMIIGVSQLKRNVSPCFGAGVTFCGGRPNALRLARDFVLARSCCRPATRCR